MTRESTRSLDRLAQQTGLVLLFLHIGMRLLIPASSEPSMNILIHALVWIGAGIWLLGCFLQGSWTLRWTGLEIPFLLWIILCILSVRRASNPQAALETAFVFSTLPLLFLWIVTALGERRARALTRFLFAITALIATYALLQRFVLFPEMLDSPEAAAALAREGEEMRGRLNSNEPFATFFYQNTFAGFLVLLLPAILGSLIDHLRARTHWKWTLPNLLLAVACIAALALTGAQGGWIAAAVAVVIFVLLELTRGRPSARAKLKAAALAVLLLCVGLVAIGPLSPSSLSARSKSMWVRSLYWDAAVNITSESPALGIGLNNFQEYYPQYKSDEQQETRKVHNDYLQILVELGVAGLFVFLLILALFARAAFARNRIVDADASLGDGAAAGFAGLCLHMLVDFDLYDFGTATALFTVAALLVLLHRTPVFIPVGRRTALLGAAVVLLIAVPTLAGIVPLQNAERARSAAKESIEAGNLIDAEAAVENAIASGSMDPQLFLLRSIISQSRFQQDAQMTHLENAVAALDTAIRIQPRSANLCLLKGSTLLSLWRAEQRAVAASGDQTGIHRAKAVGYLHNAESAFREAARLYPTSARIRFALGFAMHETGSPELAVVEFRTALRLAGLANIQRLRLEPIPEALARLRVEGREAAVKVLPAGLTPESLRERADIWYHPDLEVLLGTGPSKQP